MGENIEKTNNKTYLVIIIMLILVVIGLVGFMLYDKVFTKTEINNSTNNNTNVNTNITNNEIDNITSNQIKNFNVSQKEAYDLFKLFTVSWSHPKIDIMEEKKDIITLKDLSSDIMFDILIKALSDSDKRVLNTNGGNFEFGQYEVSAEIFYNNSLKYYDLKISLPNKYDDFGANCILNSTDNKYICDKYPTGIEAKMMWEYIPTSYDINGNKLIVNGVAVYDGVEAYYTNENLNIEYCSRDSIDECIKKDTSKLTKVAMTFNLDDNKFIFDSIKVVK